jgi:hypothetical protein
MTGQQSQGPSGFRACGAPSAGGDAAVVVSEHLLQVLGRHGLKAGRAASGDVLTLLGHSTGLPTSKLTRLA